MAEEKEKEPARGKKAVIFGSNGQDAYYLSALLEKKGISVTGISRKAPAVIGDVADYAFVSKLFAALRPDYIFHLAAVSTTRHDALFDNHRAISTGTVNILEAARLHCPEARIFLSGSAMQFRNTGQPIDESTPFEASSPYSVSRIHSVYAARYYRSTFGLFIYVGYFFNHDSPLRSESHVNQKIIKALQRIKQGSTEMLELGNIDVKKEFNYAADIVEAVWVLVNQTGVYEAVLGSGKAYSIRDWVACCFGKAGLEWTDLVAIKKNFVSEYDTLVSNPALIKSLGWEPRVDLSGLADIMMQSK